MKIKDFFYELDNKYTLKLYIIDEKNNTYLVSEISDCRAMHYYEMTELCIEILEELDYIL